MNRQCDKVLTYSVRVAQTNYASYTRTIRLNLESGGTAFIAFTATPPADWLQFVGVNTNLYLTIDEFTDVYHILQTESPVYFTALNFFDIQVGAVHTQLNLDAGESPREGFYDPQSLPAILRRARSHPKATTMATELD
jgi:hypothetical protein